MKATVDRICVGFVRAFAGTEPAVIGQRRGQPVLSCIEKSAITYPPIVITELGIEGDQQAESTRIKDDDTPMHGGTDKAIYVLPRIHYPTFWQQHRILKPGRFLGENLSVEQITEHDVRLGDIWRWGTAQLQVVGPRVPCFKLDLHHGLAVPVPHGQCSIMRLMAIHGLTGWYMRVLEPGQALACNDIVIEESDPSAPTVAEAWDTRRQSDKRLFAE